MKWYSIIGLTLITLLFSACGGDKKQAAHTTKIDTSESEIGTDTVLPAVFYKRLEGTIAQQPVVMHLQGGGGQYDGMYYYVHQGKWLALTYLADSSKDNIIYMVERNVTDVDNGHDLPEAAIKCRYVAGKLKGTWFNKDKSYDFELSEVYPEGSYHFGAQFYRDSAVAFSGKPNSPAAHISDWFPVAAEDNPSSNWINQQIRSLLGFDTAASSTSDFSLAAKQAQRDYLKGYQLEAANFKGAEEASAFLNYEQIRNIFIRYNEHDFINFESFTYAYEGGAHGNYGAKIHCYDVKNKKEMKLQDLLTADSNILIPIMERNFRLQAGMPAGEELNKILFERHLSFTENFYFTAKGIGFLYNPYEIASYAQGILHVFVPFSDLKPYLKPEFVQRMKL